MTIHLTLLDSIARLYGVSPAQLQPVSGGHFSHVYKYTDGRRACILRITPPNADVDLAAMRAILEWLAFLSAHDGPAPGPIRSRNGSLIEEVQFENRTYIAVAFEKAPGVLAEGMSPAEWSDELFQALGRTVGQCHRVARRYVPARPEFERPQWDCGGSCFNPREALADADPAILEKHVRVLSLIQSLPKDRDGYGLAHLDLHFGNFIVDAAQQHIYLFDFDDCAYGWYVMDIAMLLFDVLVVYDGLDRRQFGQRFLTNLLRGYLTQVPISPFWISQLPHFLKLLEIGIYVMLYRDYDPATADAWVSKFMPERRDRIERELPYVDLDFAALSEHLCQDRRTARPS
ncbi:MAG: phosphotransferase [Anaerolineae bacterium]|nr:phosphotransferase [Anaerolineae bacterium]